MDLRRRDLDQSRQVSNYDCRPAGIMDHSGSSALSARLQNFKLQESLEVDGSRAQLNFKLKESVVTEWIPRLSLGRRFAAALLPRLFGTNPRSHHKGATGRFELETNGFQFYAIANLDKTSLILFAGAGTRLKKNVKILDC